MAFPNQLDSRVRNHRYYALEYISVDFQSSIVPEVQSKSRIFDGELIRTGMTIFQASSIIISVALSLNGHS